ncbi:hypothetical protein JOL62DRAFT_330264 [Phyllosticta paracitricarpa]|uniref:Ubiquitin-like protease family profile domain-containing protein n=2 Tax=Phyllosticta TaxID=121621 RepID=A0ABR1LPQ1_9PEZI
MSEHGSVNSSTLSNSLQDATNMLDTNADTQRKLLGQQYKQLEQRYKGKRFSKHVKKTTLEVVGEVSQPTQHEATIASYKKRLANHWEVSVAKIEETFGQTSSKDFFQPLLKIAKLRTFDETMAVLNKARDVRKADKKPGGTSRKRDWVPKDATIALDEITPKADSEAPNQLEADAELEASNVTEVDVQSVASNETEADGRPKSPVSSPSIEVPRRHTVDNDDAGLQLGNVDDWSLEHDEPRPIKRRRRNSSSSRMGFGKEPPKTHRGANVGTKITTPINGLLFNRPAAVFRDLSVISEEPSVLFSSPAAHGTLLIPSSPSASQAADETVQPQAPKPEVVPEDRESLLNAGQLRSAVVDNVIRLAASVRPRWRALDSSCFAIPSRLDHLLRADMPSCNTLIGAVHQHNHWTLVRCIRDPEADAARVRKEHWDSMASGQSTAIVGRLVDAFLDRQQEWKEDEGQGRPLSERLCPSQSNDVDCGVFVAVVCLYLCADQSIPLTLDTKLWRQLLLCLVGGGDVVDGQYQGGEEEESEPEPSSGHLLALVKAQGVGAVTASIRQKKLASVTRAMNAVERLDDVEDLLRALEKRAAEALAEWQHRVNDSNNDASHQQAALESLRQCIDRPLQTENEISARAQLSRAEASLAARQATTVDTLQQGLAVARALTSRRLDMAKRQMTENRRILAEFEELMAAA